ncbi:MAG: hypothetical protein WBV39_07435 [Rudaea sp.]
MCDLRTMLAKLTAKNQLTLPKAATEAVGSATYFDVQTHGGAIVLTPVRIQGGDALRAKLAELQLTQKDLDEAVNWARRRVAEPPGSYATKRSAKPRKATKRKP